MKGGTGYPAATSRARLRALPPISASEGSSAAAAGIWMKGSMGWEKGKREKGKGKSNGNGCRIGSKVSVRHVFMRAGVGDMDHHLVPSFFLPLFPYPLSLFPPRAYARG